MFVDRGGRTFSHSRDFLEPLEPRKTRLKRTKFRKDASFSLTLEVFFTSGSSFFTYGMGTVSKKTKSNFWTGGGGPTTKDQTDFPLQAEKTKPTSTVSRKTKPSFRKQKKTTNCEQNKPSCKHKEKTYPLFKNQIPGNWLSHTQNLQDTQLANETCVRFASFLYRAQTPPDRKSLQITENIRRSPTFLVVLLFASGLGPGEGIFVRWIHHCFTVETPRNDSANF